MPHKYIIYISDQRCTNLGGLVDVVRKLHTVPPKYLWEFCMEEATCYPSGSYTAEVISKYLGKNLHS